MKTFKTVLLAVATLALLSANINAADEQAFNAKELSLSLYGVGDINTQARVKEAVSVGVGVGADYFLTRGFGFGVRGELSDYAHSVIDRSSGRLIARAPLWDTIAPYGYAEGGFNFERERVFAGAGGGIDVRLQKYVKIPLNAFGEAGLETDTRGVAKGRALVGFKYPLGFK